MPKAKIKPARPYPDFPLFPHATGRWAKKIRGKFHYFGPWSDPNGALQKYLDQRDDLHTGRAPRGKLVGLAIRDLCNRFLTNRRDRVETGELTHRSFQGYYNVCARVVGMFGDRLASDLDATDFAAMRREYATTHGPAALGLDIRQVRTMFKWAHEPGLLEHPARFGPDFRGPSQAILRKARNGNGLRMFEAREIRTLLDATGHPLHPMILLGINCGFGNTDCGRLSVDAVDLSGGWIDFARPKTGIQWRCPLWPETVTAVQNAIASRPKPKDDAAAELVFLTQVGTSFAKDTTQDPISRKFRELLRETGLYRRRVGFYALRHTFETIGGDSRDQVAVDHIMGHSRGDMGSVYRERISDERLKAVTDCVREWLRGDQAAR